jgi:hypothetical protein
MSQQSDRSLVLEPYPPKTDRELIFGCLFSPWPERTQQETEEINAWVDSVAYEGSGG